MGCSTLWHCENKKWFNWKYKLSYGSTFDGNARKFQLKFKKLPYRWRDFSWIILSLWTFPSMSLHVTRIEGFSDLISWWVIPLIQIAVCWHDWNITGQETCLQSQSTLQSVHLDCSLFINTRHEQKNVLNTEVSTNAIFKPSKFKFGYHDKGYIPTKCWRGGGWALNN